VHGFFFLSEREKKTTDLLGITRRKQRGNNTRGGKKEGERERGREGERRDKGPN
jgi:hypothetical protein